MRKRIKSLLAVVMAMVLVFSMAMPGFAAYDNGGNGDNGTYNGGAATEQTATPNDLPTAEVQTTSPAALAIAPFNNPIPVTWNVAQNATTITEDTDITVISQEVAILGTITIAPGVNVTLNGNGNMLQRVAGFTGNMFHVQNGASLTIGNVTIDGNRNLVPNADGSLVWVQGGSLTMNSGTVLQNNSALPSNGGGVQVSAGGSFTMTGGEISGNHATTTGGVLVMGSSNFNMTGGIIQNNTGGSPAISTNLSVLFNVVSSTVTIDGGIIVGGMILLGTGPHNITVNDSTQLTTALDAVMNATATIRLGASFSHTTPIDINSNTTLDLNNETLTVTTTTNANSINITAGNTLTIMDSGTNGTLNVTNNSTSGLSLGNGAAINTTDATLYILSGTVDAQSNFFAGAGIGGGEGSDGGTVTISGTANVIAQGGNLSAGIGGGRLGAGGTININGGTVTATGGTEAAGIGGGATTTTAMGASGNITISPTATVTANRSAAGHANTNSIGAGVTPTGESGPVGTINIPVNSNLTVNASGNFDAVTLSAPTGGGTVAEGSISGNISATATRRVNNPIVYQLWQNSANSNTGGTQVATFTSNAGNSFAQPAIAIPTGLTQGTYYFYIVAEVQGQGPNAVNWEAARTATVQVVVNAPAPIATIANVTIGNAGGNVIITLANDTFAATLTNPTTWITNIPTGLTQTATRNSDTQVTITISGGAEWTHTAMPIAVSIPAASLVTSTTNLAATTNPSAVFTTFASRITAQITAPQPNGGAAWNTTDESGNITRNVVVTLPGRIYTSATITASGTGVSGSASLAATDSGDTITVPVTVPGTRPADLTVTFTLTGNAAEMYPSWPGSIWNFVTITVPATTAGAVQEPTPTAAINFTAEQLTGFASGEVYLINGTAHTATSGVININPAWMGTTINIVKQGTGTNTNSDPQSLAIPARPTAPSGVGSTNTTDGNNNGTITGVDSTMEYRTGTGAWIAVSGADTTIAGLVAGTYEVRVRATASAFASASASVTIAPSSAVVDVTSVTVSAAGSATSITTNGGTLQMSATVLPANATNPAVTWSIASGSGATINTSGLLTATSNGTVTVRATSVSNPSVFEQLQITISGQGTGGGNNNNGTSGSDPSPDYDWLNPSSTNFDLANPRSITVTFTQRDFAFQNALRLGSGNNAINLVRDTDFTVSRNNNTFTVTISEDFLAENLTVGTRSLHFILSGNRTVSLTIRVTDTRPTATPDLPDDEAPTMPIVQVDLSPALRAELMERLGDRFDDLEVIVTHDIAQTTPQGAPMGDIHGFWDVIVEFIVRGDSADGSDDEIITDFVNHYYLSADMSNFYLGNLNHHRITALNTTSNEYRQYGYIGSIVGGKVVFDPVVDLEAETPAEIATFALQSNHTGGLMIAYVRNLIRLDLNLNSPTITDLAGNAPTQTMDVLPFIQDGRTLIPIRFISDALGAEIDWTNATDDRPLTVYLTLNGQTLSFGIGEITPELAALGMDVPAQLMGNRTMVPLRFVAEFFGAVVNWDSETRNIEIISMGTSPSPITNTNHNPLTGGTPIMALAREDEDEE